MADIWRGAISARGLAPGRTGPAGGRAHMQSGSPIETQSRPIVQIALSSVCSLSLPMSMR